MRWILLFAILVGCQSKVSFVGDWNRSAYLVTEVDFENQPVETCQVVNDTFNLAEDGIAVRTRVVDRVDERPCDRYDAYILVESGTWAPFEFDDDGTFWISFEFDRYSKSFDDAKDIDADVFSGWLSLALLSEVEDERQLFLGGIGRFEEVVP